MNIESQQDQESNFFVEQKVAGKSKNIFSPTENKKLQRLQKIYFESIPIAPFIFSNYQRT
jgi:hypothetical protein